MADRIVYAICADDGKFETMTKEQILAAIEQAVEDGHVSDPDGAVFSRIKEIRAGQCEQLWVGTEAQFNALNPAPDYGRAAVRIGENGVLYLCSDDSTLKSLESHVDNKNNPHEVTFEQIMGESSVVPVEKGGTGAKTAKDALAKLGAVNKAGDTMTGQLTIANGDKWVPIKFVRIIDGVQYEFEIAVDGNRAYIMRRVNGEISNFVYLYDNDIRFGKPIAIEGGGTGATDAPTARAKLGITPANIGASPTGHNHTKDEITDFPEWAKSADKPSYTAGEVGAVSKTGDTMTGGLILANGESWVPIFFRRTIDGVLNEFELSINSGSAYLIRRVNNEVINCLYLYDNSTVLGKPLGVTSGGTGATDAQTARTNLGAAASSHKHTKSEITDFPTSMPASDVSAWAKASTKPTYTAKEVGAVNNAGDTMTGSLYNNGIVEAGTGQTYAARLQGSTDRASLSARDAENNAVNYLMLYPDKSSLGKPLTVDGGGTGASTKKAARKNLGAEIQCGVVDDVGTSGVTVTFSEAFSGIPVVTATGGSENASVYVRNITKAGFTLISGSGNNDGVQWQAIYISD